jgi:hypothetical protein
VFAGNDLSKTRPTPELPVNRSQPGFTLDECIGDLSAGS